MADKPVDEIVKLLRLTLAEAERGEVRGIVLVSVTGSGNFTTRYHAQCSASSLLAAGLILWETVKTMFVENAMEVATQNYPPVDDA